MDKKPERILLVEDDQSLRETITTVLEHEGFSVEAVASAEAAQAHLGVEPWRCILADFKLPGHTGIEFLSTVRSTDQRVPFVLMTAYGSIDTAVQAMKLGANDFLTKPFEPQTLSTALRQVIDHRRIIDREQGLRTRRERSFRTESSPAQAVLNDARKVARVDSSVLILGESGTGKELLARFIHDHSPRKDEPFIALNCGAIPHDLLESDLFGHEAGAFTGATQTRVGVFEFAAQGTIFLDEIGDMPAALQVKLLRALQEHEIKRVGSNRIIKVAPRIIAATNRDVQALMKTKELREDLYYRLAVVTLEIPPLRNRPEDVALLTQQYLAEFSKSVGKSTLKLDAATAELLRSYPWPGNARELENVIERAVIMATDTILPEHLGITLNVDFGAMSEATVSLPEIALRAARKAEIELITRVLNQTHGNKTKAAEILGVSYKTLLTKVKDYAIAQPEAP